MLQLTDSWTGDSHTDFSSKDIANMRKFMLFSWAMSGKFKIDFLKLFGYYPGINLSFFPCFWCKQFHVLFLSCTCRAGHVVALFVRALVPELP